MGGGSPMRIGGDGSGGSPMKRMSTKAAVRVGGDGSGGGWYQPQKSNNSR